MAEYEKDKRFNAGWMVGGVFLMFLTNFLATFGAGAAGVTNLWTLMGIACAAYLIGGFVIGWKSEGRTILEAGLAAVIAILAVQLLTGHLVLALINPVAFAVGVGVPFVCAVLGAWLGELVQGDVIRTSD